MKKKKKRRRNKPTRSSDVAQRIATEIDWFNLNQFDVYLYVLLSVFSSPFDFSSSSQDSNNINNNSNNNSSSSSKRKQRMKSSLILPLDNRTGPNHQLINFPASCVYKWIFEQLPPRIVFPEAFIVDCFLSFCLFVYLFVCLFVCLICLICRVRSEWRWLIPAPLPPPPPPPPPPHM